MSEDFMKLHFYRFVGEDQRKSSRTEYFSHYITPATKLDECNKKQVI